MAWAHVQSALQLAVSGVNAKAFPSAVSAGSLLVCAIDLEVDSATITSVSDSKGNPWTAIGTLQQQLPVGGACQIYYAFNAIAGATTVSVTPTTGQSVIAIHEYSGIDTVSPLDTNLARVVTGGATAVDSGNASTFEANELIFGCIISLQTITAGAGFTQRQYQSHLNEFQTEDHNGDGGVENVTATLASNSSYVALLAAFRQPFTPSSGRQGLSTMGIG